jgi:hypothetical protein
VNDSNALSFADSRDLLRQIVRACYHKGGLRTARLLDVEPQFFAGLQEEVLRFVETHRPSDVSGATHVTNWTKPFGAVYQFSLLNRSGRVDDTSADHDLTTAGKRFHFGAQFPKLAAFIEAFPHAINMRLNAMGEKAGLSPHEEHPVRYLDRRNCWLTTRFHLPVVTNPEVEVLLDGDLYRLEPGRVFYFNNGCVHSAVNRGGTMRYHLVWDMLLTAETFDLLFSDTPVTIPFLRKTAPEHRAVVPHRRERIREYQIFGPGLERFTRWRLQRFGIAPYQFQNVYNHWRFLRHRLFETPRLFQT